MQFVDHDLGYRRGGEIVEITLSGSAANVRLMDSSNFSSYRNGRQHRYIGGLAKQSPVRLQIPHSGNWHVTVDMQGLRGSVRSSARILPGPLPELREAPLSSIPSLVQHNPPPGTDPDDNPQREYDVFISHASEDKEGVVRPLAHVLRRGGLKVWYDEFELRIGDSLRRKIDMGLARSRFGVVVLSRSFFGKGWTNYELDGLVTRRTQTTPDTFCGIFRSSSAAWFGPLSPIVRLEEIVGITGGKLNANSEESSILRS